MGEVAAIWQLHPPTTPLKLTLSSVIMVRATRGGAVWSARVAHNHKVAGSNPAPATKKDSYRKMAIFLGFGLARFGSATGEFCPPCLP